MKYCSSCGSQMQVGLSFCTNCGAPLNNGNNNQQNYQNANSGQYTEPNYQNANMGGYPRVTNRNIGVAILLSIVTCGIYALVWFISMVNEVNRVCDDEKSSQSGGVVFLLTLITCGIYGIVWFFQAGKRMENAGRKYGIQISDNSTVYLILGIFQLSIVNYCLLQSDLNKFSN